MSAEVGVSARARARGEDLYGAPRSPARLRGIARVRARVCIERALVERGEPAEEEEEEEEEGAAAAASCARRGGRRDREAPVRSAGAMGGEWGGGGSACGARSPHPQDTHTKKTLRARGISRGVASRGGAVRIAIATRRCATRPPPGDGARRSAPRALRARSSRRRDWGGLREAEALMTRTVGEGRGVRSTDRGRCSAAEPSGGGAGISIRAQTHCRRRPAAHPGSIDRGAGKGGGAIPPEGASEQGRAGRRGSAPAAATPAPTRRTTAPLARRHAPLHRRCLRKC